MSELRPYQVTAIDSALAALSNSGSAVLQMPTGSGKTRAATEIVRNEPGTVWFICHRVEIAQQAAKAFRAAGIDFGMISPRAIDPENGKKYPFEPAKRVQIIMVGSLARRMADLPAPSLVIWDECHHVAAKSWSAIREQLADAKHLGLTATPERLDGKGLAEWFAELVPGPTIESLIADEWLSPFRYFAPSDPDLSAAKMQAGDYDKKDLARIMNAPVLIGDAVAEYRRTADGKRAVAFCASVAASRALVERFNAEGVPALHVDGGTAPEARGEAVKALADGDIKVLSNVEVFTEGFDVPGIEAVILMRPTKSPTLLLQMIGRALRFVEGKTAVIMDHAGLWQDHGNFARYESWSIHGGAAAARRRAGVGGLRCCPKCKHVPFERVPVCENCGFEFPTAREIGEYDGELREMRGDVPEGWETPSFFSRRIGISKTSAFRLIKEYGMPHDPILGINVEEATKWLKDKDFNFVPPLNVSDPSCYERQYVFAKRAGVNTATLSHWSSFDDFPRSSNGWVHIENGLEWVRIRRQKDHLRVWTEDGLENNQFEPVKYFAGRHQISVATASDIIRTHRAELAPNGWVRKSASLDMAAATLGKKSLKKDPARNALISSGTHEVPAKFSARLGVSKDTARTWIKYGYVVVDNGLINIDKSISLLKERPPKRTPPLFIDKPEQYEAKKWFAKRLRISETRVRRWVSLGLPCASNGWVHIQRGLEWVRDNTSIQIPPEAWPSANDNAAASAAA